MNGLGWQFVFPSPDKVATVGLRAELSNLTKNFLKKAMCIVSAVIGKKVRLCTRYLFNPPPPLPGSLAGAISLLLVSH